MNDSNSRVYITVAQFRAAFPMFDAENYPDAFVETILSQAYCYVSNLKRGAQVCDCQVLMIELMAAHLLFLAKKAQNAATSGGGSLAAGLMQRSKVGEVEVSMAIPTHLTAFRSWLMSSPWGSQLIGLCMSHAMPIFAGGSFNRIYWTSW